MDWQQIKVRIKPNTAVFVFTIDLVYEIRQVSVTITRKALTRASSFVIGDGGKAFQNLLLEVKEVGNTFKIINVRPGPSTANKVLKARSIMVVSRYWNPHL